MVYCAWSNIVKYSATLMNCGLATLLLMVASNCAKKPGHPPGTTAHAAAQQSSNTAHRTAIAAASAMATPQKGTAPMEHAATAVADMVVVSGLYSSLEERLTLLTLGEEIKLEKEQEEQKNAQRWAVEEKRLQALLEQYSNRWEQIPNERDRFMVARNIEDPAIRERILLSLLSSPDVSIIADVACYLRFWYEHMGRKEDALAIYARGDQAILKGRTLPEALAQMTDNERRAISRLYNDNAVELHERNDHRAAAENFRNAALSMSFDPERGANAYYELSLAYHNLKDRDSALWALAEAEKSLARIQDTRGKARVIYLWDDIQEGKRMLHNGEFTTASWAH